MGKKIYKIYTGLHDFKAHGNPGPTTHFIDVERGIVFSLLDQLSALSFFIEELFLDLIG